jgi:hypothetical protein
MVVSHKFLQKFMNQGFRVLRSQDSRNREVMKCEDISIVGHQRERKP